jgi:hypothetical protein
MLISKAKYRVPDNFPAWILYLSLFLIPHRPVSAQSASYDHLINPLSIARCTETPGLIPHTISVRDRNLVFMDSVREKASRNKFTRKLYEIVVAAPDSAGHRNVSGESELPYSGFTGSLIRRIEIRRLNVFGADVDQPGEYRPYPGQKILNKTHVNTNERIIRNNLLFSAGDTLSPILLSDNERLLRELSFIDDARINVIPVSKDEVDILVITKDVYSLGGSYSPDGLERGVVSAFDNNFIGLGHELGIKVPYNSNKPDLSPGFGIHYMVDNIASSFINMNVFWQNDLGDRSYGISIERRLFSYETKYAGGISVKNVDRRLALDTLTVPNGLKYNLQDYWISRSFLLERESVTRLIIGTRYTNNNVYDRPEILSDSYHNLQKYSLYLASVTFSRQRYYKANLVYGYGRTEDIPYGGAITVTAGREFNEFKLRNYAASQLSFSKSFEKFGYLHASAGLGSFINNKRTEQGIFFAGIKYFSPLIPVSRSMIRNFMRLNYTRGFNRNLDEHLRFYRDGGFSGYRNDSIHGSRRVSVNLESVVFSPLNLAGFRFAFYGFADLSSLSETGQAIAHGTILSGIGLGIRVRNDNLVFKTFQIRVGFFPDPPANSRINYVTVSGENPARFDNFEPGEPSMIPYR